MGNYVLRESEVSNHFFFPAWRLLSLSPFLFPSSVSISLCLASLRTVRHCCILCHKVLTCCKKSMWGPQSSTQAAKTGIQNILFLSKLISSGICYSEGKLLNMASMLVFCYLSNSSSPALSLLWWTTVWSAVVRRALPELHAHLTLGSLNTMRLTTLSSSRFFL